MLDEILNSLGKEDSIHDDILPEDMSNYDNNELLHSSIDNTEVSIISSQSISSSESLIANEDLDALTGSYDSVSMTLPSSDDFASASNIGNYDSENSEISSSAEMLEPTISIYGANHSEIIEPKIDGLNVKESELNELNERALGIERTENHSSNISFEGKLDPHVCQQLHGCSGHNECDKCYGSTITSL